MAVAHCPGDLAGAELSFLGEAAFLMSDKPSVLQCKPVTSPGKGNKGKFVPPSQSSGRDGDFPSPVDTARCAEGGFCRLELTQAASQGKMSRRSSLLLPQVINPFVHRWPRSERVLEVQEIRRKRSNKESLSCLDWRMMKRLIFLMLGREGTFLSSKGQNSDLLCFCSILYIKFFNV